MEVFNTFHLCISVLMGKGTFQLIWLQSTICTSYHLTALQSSHSVAAATVTF